MSPLLLSAPPSQLTASCARALQQVCGAELGNYMGVDSLFLNWYECEQSNSQIETVRWAINVHRGCPKKLHETGIWSIFHRSIPYSLKAV